MADYWKSQDKKFCDFCKCWIADNKPSIQFHESGKKHQENVNRQLSEISKQSIVDQKKREEDNADFKKMEQEALKAYMKDIERGGDYSTQQLKDNYDIPVPKAAEVPGVPLPQPTCIPLPQTKPSSSKVPKPVKPTYSEPIGPEIRSTGGALGQWESVQEASLPELDLPQQNYITYQVPTLSSDYPELKLKEKTVQSLQDRDSFVKKEESEAPAFKKRKVNRGNARQRLDTD